MERLHVVKRRHVRGSFMNVRRSRVLLLTTTDTFKLAQYGGNVSLTS